MATDSSNPKMAGQRNENSVLFSLNNLQALASSNGPSAKPSGGGGGGAKPGVDMRPGYANSQTEGSGLIDIRAMAASSLASPSSSSSSKPDDLPALAAPPIFSPMAAPIMMPAPPQGMPKAMWAVIAVGGVLVVGMILVTVLVLTRKPEVVANNNPPPNTATDPTKSAVPTDPTKAAVPTDPTKAAAPKTGEEPKAAAPDKPAADPGDKPAKGERKHRDKGDKAVAAPSDPGKKTSADKGVVAPPMEPSKPKAGKPKDDLDDLLGGGDSKPKKAEKVDENLPETLDKPTIVAGMKKVSEKVTACYKQFNVPGLANVQTTIANSGRVSNASVSGAFAGTPTGSCVEKAVKSASFPRFKSGTQTITYPFMLR
jgi:hypothetical protein